MVFSSVSFLYYFLPVVLILYFAVPGRLKNIILLSASLLFYFYGEPKYMVLLLVAAFSGYIHGIWIDKLRETKHARLPLVMSIVVGIGLLMTFKYADFFIVNANRFFRTELALLKLALPIGISFYTFQVLSYTIDVYRGVVKVQRNFLDFATYVALFPQLIAGPIVRYATVEKPLARRTHSIAAFAAGVNRFILGLAKKVLFADTLGELEQVLQAAEPTVLLYWLAALAFMLRIYFDFSGYSDMAIGLGRIFGFHFPENFNYPYMAKSITDFWRRWHISLGTWFKQYVYIPMGGNRVSRLKLVRNITLVWFLVGFWHGADWNFIFWGLLFAVLLAVEKLFLLNLLDRLPRLAGRLYVLFIVLLSFVLFNAAGMAEATDNLRAMFGCLPIPLSSPETAFYLRSNWLLFLAAALGATPLAASVVRKIRGHGRGEKIINLLEPVVLAALLLLVTGYLIDSSFNPFVYFRF